ncbi:hypothetical protein D3C81_1875360 [compost metagenome]
MFQQFRGRFKELTGARLTRFVERRHFRAAKDHVCRTLLTNRHQIAPEPRLDLSRPRAFLQIVRINTLPLRRRKAVFEILING